MVIELISVQQSFAFSSHLYDRSVVQLTLPGLHLWDVPSVHPGSRGCVHAHSTAWEW